MCGLDSWFYFNNILWGLFSLALLAGECFPLILSPACPMKQARDLLVLSFGFDFHIAGFDLLDPVTNASVLLLSNVLCWIRPSTPRKIISEVSCKAICQAMVIGLQVWIGTWFLFLIGGFSLLARSFVAGIPTLVNGLMTLWTAVHRLRNPDIYGVNSGIFGGVLKTWAFGLALLFMGCSVVIFWQYTFGPFRPCTMAAQSLLELMSSPIGANETLCLSDSICSGNLPHCLAWPNATAGTLDSCMQVAQDSLALPWWVAQLGVYILWGSLAAALRFYGSENEAKFENICYESISEQNTARSR